MDHLRRTDRVDRAQDGDEADVLLHGNEVVHQGGRDLADRLRHDDHAQRLPVGQTQRSGRVTLGRVHRVQARAQHLGHVRGVREDQRDRAQEGGRDARRRVERGDAEADQVEDHQEGDASENVRVRRREEADREEHGTGQRARGSQQGCEHCDSQHRDQQDPDVEPQAGQDLGEGFDEVLAVEEGVAGGLPPVGVDDHGDEDSRDHDRGDQGDEDRPDCLLAPISAPATLHRRNGGRGQRVIRVLTHELGSLT